MYLVGLTGGIATGKSSVSNILRELDCTIIDADLIARQVVEVGSKGWRRVRDAFGSDICLEDGSIDRAKLGQIIFSDASKRKLLNSITHPLIRREMMWLAFISFIKGRRYVILDTPLLLENRSVYSWIVSEIAVVYCDEDIQLQRLIARNQLTHAEAKQRISSQRSLEWKKSMVTHPKCLINNNNGLSDIREQVLEFKKYLDSSWRPELIRLALLAIAGLVLFIILW